MARTTITARRATSAPSTPEVEAALAGLALTEPGDTGFQLSDGQLVASRTLVDGDEAAAHDAQGELERAAAAAAELLDAWPTADGGSAALDALTPPTVPPIPNLDVALSSYMTVTSPQAAWATPAGDGPPKLQLQPGVWYDVLARQGDWAKVRDSEGVITYTDARTLVPAANTGGRT